MIQLAKYFKTEMLLDNEEDGTLSPVKLEVKRFKDGEYVKFQADYEKAGNPSSDRLLNARGTGENDEAKLASLSDADRAEYDALNVVDEAFAQGFIGDAVKNFIRVPAGEIKDEDDADVLTGEQLLKAYGSRADVLRTLVRLVWSENTLSAERKKALRSLFDLGRSLNAHLLGAAGLIPAQAAANASDAASAKVGDVTESTEDRSGSTTTV